MASALNIIIQFVSWSNYKGTVKIELYNKGCDGKECVFRAQGLHTNQSELTCVCMYMGISDSNLANLEAIHYFVEILNEYLHNVTFYEVHTVLDEMPPAGEI
uniref:uncharacterized protein LOC129509409 n=1 Tax=Nyctereutes procyonoides TaxID=34880 RepID=UPI002443D011|nr:uncharacterized protein LOC129509409 [Nyctereutes procyonoides]